MNVDALLAALVHANQLKRTARTGWVQRGVPRAESVAAHTYGVGIITLLLAGHVDAPIDLGRALAMAIVHDLPEGLTTDIPAPAWRFMPPGIKRDVERRALAEMLGDAPRAAALREPWEALHAGDTPEARLVDDADKLDMYLQAVMYEEQTGNRQLSEFWASPHTFHFPVAQALYDALRAGRSP